MLFTPETRNRAPTFVEAAALGFTSSLGPLSANTYVPGFHRMAEDLGTSFIHIEQTLTVYLITYALCSIFAGTLSDSLGRKKTMVSGMLLFSIASIGAMLAPNFWTLCFWRVMQGMGAAVGQVVTQAIVRDRWSGVHAARMNGMIAMFFAISPAIAPVIGGWIIAQTSWHYVFVLLAVYSASIALFTQVGVAETLPAANRTPLQVREVLSGYKTGFSHKAFMAGVISHGFCFMGGILYTAGAADFVITIMKFDVDEFAWYTVPTVILTLAGSWSSAYILKRLGARPMVYGISFGTVVVCGLIALDQYFVETGYPWALLCPCIYWCTCSMLRPVMMAMNLDYFPTKRGLAASIQQCFVTASFSVCSAFWVPIVMGSAWKYSLVSAFCALMVLVLWIISMRLRPEALKKAGVVDSF